MKQTTQPQSEAPAVQIEQNLEAILAMQTSDEKALTSTQRAIERFVAIISVPAFLIVTVALVAAWIAANLAMSGSKVRPWDPPPFVWLQDCISLISLIVMIVVVVTQSRQGKLAERNAHIDLQVNLLVEQKVSKIIQLLEEIRSDSPHLRNRRDEEAEVLKTSIDPLEVAAFIADKMDSPLPEERALE